MIPAIRQTLGNHQRIPCIRFHPLSLLRQHGCWRQNHTFNTCGCKLVIQRIAQTTCLIATLDIVFIIHTQFHFKLFNEHQDIFIVCSYLDICKNAVFFADHRLHCTKCVIFTMDIHPNFDYSIHSGLLLYVVIPVTIVLVKL